MAKKETIFLYTSSHGKRSFSNIFESLFSNSKRFYMVAEENLFAVGGRKMEDGVVDEVSHYATQFAPLPQWVILNFGDNDLREKRRVEDIVAEFAEVVDRLTAIPYCRVVLTSLVPSYARYEETKHDFKSLNDHLKVLANASPKVTFCDFTRCLFQDGILDGNLYRDNVHLNYVGSKTMAESIFAHLINQPKIKTP